MDLPIRPPGRSPEVVDETLLRWGMGEEPDLPAMAASLTRLLDSEAPSPVGMGRLIRHIHERYHRVLAGVMEDALTLASVCEAAHGASDVWPHGLSDLVAEILDELEQHQQREYAVVFPMLLGGSAGTPGVAGIMTDEHARLRCRLDALTAMTRQFTAPPGACVKWRVLYVLCCKIDLDLREQMRMEENELFSPFLRHRTEDAVCSDTMSAAR
jgi:regulator of cell morphogenesis and NO signaling